MPVESFPLDRGRELVTRWRMPRATFRNGRPLTHCVIFLSVGQLTPFATKPSLGELTPSCKFQVTPLRDSLSVNELTTGANRGVRSSQGFKKLTNSRTDLRRAGAKNAGHRAGAGNGIRLPDFVAGS